MDGHPDTMAWAATITFGEGWAVYRGSAADHTLHAHAAIQVVFAEAGSATVVSGKGEDHVGAVILIRPLAEHALTSRGNVTLLYAEPQSPLAFRLSDLAAQADICVIDPNAFPAQRPDEDLPHWIGRVAERHDAKPPLDRRLRHALALLAETPGTASISETSRRCDLSESRLRTLAREQLGLPLSTWLVWRKLERAARAMNDGETLAMAAAAGGFADQAHLARAMRRMFGITPRTAQSSSLRRDSRSVQELM